MSYLPVSRRWAGHLAGQAGLSKEKENILAYVIEVLLINTINLVLALLLGFLVGAWRSTVICLVTVFFFRHTAGGAHSNSPWRCGLITVTVFPLMALLAQKILLDQAVIDLLAAVVFSAGLAILLALAPVDSPAAPIVSPARRKKLKFLSVVVLLTSLMIIVILRQTSWAYAKEAQLCILFSISWVCFMLSKQGHQSISMVDKITIVIKKRG